MLVQVFRRTVLGVALSVSTLLFSPSSVAFEYDTDTAEARAVAQAKEAVNRKQWTQLPALVQAANDDLLRIYADYWLAEYAVWSAKDVNQVPVAEAFLERYPDTYMAESLKANWVLAAAQSGAFLKIQQIGEFVWYNKQVRCAKLEARHMTGQKVTGAQAMQEFAPGDACWSMLEQFVADAVFKPTQIATLIREYLEINYTKTATKIASIAFKRQTAAQFGTMLKSPSNWLKRLKGSVKGDDALLASLALARQARKNPTRTARDVTKTWANRLPADDVAWVWGQLGMQGALDHLTQADTWYRKAGNIELSDANYEWRVRSALRQPVIRWDWVQKTIDWMPERLRKEAGWQYWLGRSLLAQGKKEQANQIFQAISGEFNFYGQLALEELGQKIVAPEKPDPVTEEEFAQARANPHLQQAVALFKLGLRREAVPQWNFALRDLNDRQLLAAAEFAREQQIYDRVVNTSDRTEKEIDFSQRFIAPFESKVTAQAQSINLDPAWVYGLIRQESRFIMDARSVVGASGLMQLMPATAKYVAKKIGMKNFRQSKVNEFDVNTKLGTHYLSMVLEQLDGSQVLASAGYNAGPGRPAQWRKTLSRPVEGAIFAETIPFNETRDYVKNVLSNATYYAAIFTGEPQSLKARLGRIAPK